MRRSVIWALLAAHILQTVLCTVTFDAFRIVQFSKDSTLLGSQRASVSLTVSMNADDADLAKKVVILQGDHLTADKCEKLLESKPGGLVVVLPAKTSDAWRRCEHHLISSSWEFPIYLAKREPTLEVLSSIEQDGGSGYHLTISVPEGAKITVIPVVNIQGWIGGAAVDGTTIPTIAVVGHYDASAAAPELAFGINSNAAGATAVLELARVFSKLYSSSRSVGSYNLLFVLTGGASLNYEGSRKFLGDAETQAVLGTVEYVLCLDSLISDSKTLYLHSTKHPKEGNVAELFTHMTRIASNMGTKLEFVSRKVNLSDPDVYWEHEQFARRRVAAGTLSSRSEPATWTATLDSLDVINSGDAASLKSRIHLIAESLAHFIFNLTDDVTVCGGSLAVDEELLANNLKFLGTRPRMAAFAKKDSDYIEALEEELKSFSKEVVRRDYSYDGEGGLVFYSSTKAEVNVYRTRSLVFDAILLVSVLAYLLALHVYFKGFDSIRKFIRSFGNKKKA